MINFISVPVGTKVPGAYIEFDTSKAIQGTFIKQYRALIIGGRLTGGTKAEKQIDLVRSAAEAGEFYGKGSQLYHMINAFISENENLNAVYAASLDDDGSAVKATGSYEILTPPTANGTLSLMIAGRRYRVAVLDADTEEDIVDKLVTEIAADDYREVDAVKDGSNLDLLNITARHGGLEGNNIDIRENFFDDEVLPEGVTSTITAMSSGTANPDIADIITAMGEEQYDVIIMPYTDTANLTAMQTELVDRWGPIRANDGHLFAFRKESFSAFSTFLDGRNNAQESIMNITGPTPPYHWAANVAALVAASAQSDPALPFQTLNISQVRTPAASERFDYADRNQMLIDGGSTFRVDSGGNVLIERLRTTRVENEFDAPDEALADLNPKLTLSYLRFDYRAMLLTKYPRHKLRQDGVRFGPGARIVTPKSMKAEAIARFELWEQAGLVEGLEQFKRDLIVEINSSDPNRLDHLLPPDLVNQLRVNGVQIGFLL